MLPEGDEFELKLALATIGPISVAIDASRPHFAFYHHGEWLSLKMKSGLDGKKWDLLLLFFPMIKVLFHVFCGPTGVYIDHKCSKNVNHGVLAVGYGNERGHDYWLVKNRFVVWILDSLPFMWFIFGNRCALIAVGECTMATMATSRWHETNTTSVALHSMLVTPSCDQQMASSLFSCTWRMKLWVSLA